MPTRVLFVDDEPSLRLTLPSVLERHGFQVTATATVAEALQTLHSQTFDVLLADLNVGEPGDGFTVVSAMRRTQPQCITFILTGYPDFETALEAIRNQVDDYLIKPANVNALVDSMRKKLANPVRPHRIPTRPAAAVLREHADEILTRALHSMKQHPRLSKLRLSDQQRTDHIPQLLSDIIAHLDANGGTALGPAARKAAATHGKNRRRQGYSQSLLVDDIRVLDSTCYEVLQENILGLDLSRLLPDLSRLNDTLEAHLQEALKAFNRDQEAA
jgi:ActR/RegA family two-component response regulator